MSEGHRSRSFTRNVVVLASGTAGGQAIAVLVSPILSRLYQPSAFGTFGVYLAIVSILSVAAALRYESALPLPETEEEAADLLALTVVITLVLSVVVGVLTWVGVAAGGDMVASDLRPLLPLLPVGFLLTGIQQILTFWAIRRHAFGASAQSSIAQGGTQAATQLAFGVVSPSPEGMAIGYLVARMAGSLRLAPTVEPMHRAFLRGLSAGRLRAVARRYDRFPLFTLWAQLVSAVSVQTPVLMLAALFNATVVGWFSITIRVIQLPSNVIGLAVGQVFYARVSRTDPAEVTQTSRAMFRALMTLGATPMWMLAIGGRYAFTLVFGDAWAGAGWYAQLLAPWLILDFISAPLTSLAYVRNRQATQLTFQAVLLASRVASLAAGAALGGADAAMALYAATSAVLVGGYLMWLLRIGNVGTRAPLILLGREVAIGLGLAAPTIAATALNLAAPAWLAAALASLAAVGLRGYRTFTGSAVLQAARGAS